MSVAELSETIRLENKFSVKTNSAGRPKLGLCEDKNTFVSNNDNNEDELKKSVEIDSAGHSKLGLRLSEDKNTFVSHNDDGGDRLGLGLGSAGRSKLGLLNPKLPQKFMDKNTPAENEEENTSVEELSVTLYYYIILLYFGIMTPSKCSLSSQDFTNPLGGVSCPRC